MGKFLFPIPLPSREKNKHKTKQQKKNLAICVPDKTIGNKEGLG
jgi:hypothetical protein